MFFYNSDNDYLTLQEVNIDPEVRKQYLDMIIKKFAVIDYKIAKTKIHIEKFEEFADLSDMINEDKQNLTNYLTEKKKLEEDISMVKQRDNDSEEIMKVKSIADEYTQIFMEHYNINESDFKKGILQPGYTLNGGNYLSKSNIGIGKRKYFKSRNYY